MLTVPPMRFFLLMFAAWGTLIAMSVTSAESASRHFYIGPTGGVGPLLIDRSRLSNVIDMMGAPDASGISLRTNGNAPVRSEALGYSCRSRQSVYRMPVSGSYCLTVFYVSARSNRLAAVFTASSRFVGPGQIYTGEPAGQAERQLGVRATQGCQAGFNLGSTRGRALMFIPVEGGRAPNTIVHGGRIGPLKIESNRFPVGLLFC